MQSEEKAFDKENVEQVTDASMNTVEKQEE